MSSPVSLTVDQLRRVLQLPERPFEDPYFFDGSSYYDFSHRELCTFLTASGTVSGSPFLFNLGTDFQITAGTVDWSIAPAMGGKKPDLNTRFVLDYTYSRLGGDSATDAVAYAQIIVAQDLGFNYPYASTTSAGNAYADMATYLAALCAAREACYTLSTTEIDLAEKSRRGSVLLDDNKKTEDWSARAKEFNDRYNRYLTMARGPVRKFLVSSLLADRSVLGYIGQAVFDDASTTIPYAEDSGLLY